MAEEGRFVCQPQALCLFAVLVAVDYDLGSIVEMGLGVDAPGEGQPDQLHLSRYRIARLVLFAEHQAADLNTPDTAFEIKLAAECLSGELVEGDMWIKILGVDIEGMAACGADDLDAGIKQLFADIFNSAKPVAEIFLLDNLLQTNGNSLQITTCKSAISDETLGKYQ